MTRTAEELAARVAATLRDAGHAEAGESRNVGITMATTGFGIFASGATVTVVAFLGDDLPQSCHPDAPGAIEAGRRLVAAYKEALEAAGYAVASRGRALDVTGSPKAT